MSWVSSQSPAIGVCAATTAGVRYRMKARYLNTATSVSPRDARASNVRVRDKDPGSVDLHAASQLLVLVKDELDWLLVRKNSLVDADGEGFRVRLWVLDREVYLEVTEGQAPDALGELRFVTVRTAVDVQPSILRAFFRTPHVVCFDDERVAFPVADGVTVPTGLRFPLLGGLVPTRGHVTQPIVPFVFDQDQLRRLDDRARLRLLVKLKEAHRQAVGVGIFLRFDVQSLLPELRGPRRVRQAIGHVPAGFEEGGHRRPTRGGRKALRHRLHQRGHLA